MERRGGDGTATARFDFPYGHPRGLAGALGLPGTPWRAVWDLLGAEIADDAANANNRFAVADAINRRVAGPGPFWGCPPSAATPALTATVTGMFAFPVAGLRRLRATVLHAEIWPGIVDVPADAPIRDEAQVRLMCEWAARQDRDGTLGGLFAPGLDPATAAAVVAEEGWILGAPG